MSSGCYLHLAGFVVCWFPPVGSEMATYLACLSSLLAVTSTRARIMSILSIALLLWLEQYLELRRYSKPFLNLSMNDYNMVGRPGKLFAEMAAAVPCSPA